MKPFPKRPKTAPASSNLQAYQAQRQQEFAQPQFGAFATAYGVAASAWLVRLYSLGLRLGCEPLQVELSRGGLNIQHFSPLAAAISAGKRYDGKLFDFAAGWDGESLLIAVEDPPQVYVDFSHGEPDVEPVELDADELLGKLVARLSGDGALAFAEHRATLMAMQACGYGAGY